MMVEGVANFSYLLFIHFGHQVKELDSTIVFVEVNSKINTAKNFANKFSEGLRFQLDGGVGLVCKRARSKINNKTSEESSRCIAERECGKHKLLSK